MFASSATATGERGVAEIDDNRLVNLALGLSEDPELAAALRASPELRQHFQEIAAELRGLDRELLGLRAQLDRRELGGGCWRVLLAVDGCRDTQRLIATAAALAASCDGEVVVAHVRVLERPGQGPPLETQADASELVDHIVEHLTERGVRAAGALRAASRRGVAGEIVSLAATGEIDLIVMGSGGHSLLAGWLFGSLIHEVMRRAPCPVVIAR
jgi:nucleotide-binding universal stress UspA family protein